MRIHSLLSISLVLVLGSCSSISNKEYLDQTRPERACFLQTANAITETFEETEDFVEETPKLTFDNSPEGASGNTSFIHFEVLEAILKDMPSSPYEMDVILGKKHDWSSDQYEYRNNSFAKSLTYASGYGLMTEKYQDSDWDEAGGLAKTLQDFQKLEYVYVIGITKKKRPVLVKSILNGNSFKPGYVEGKAVLYDVHEGSLLAAKTFRVESRKSSLLSTEGSERAAVDRDLLKEFYLKARAWFEKGLGGEFVGDIFTK